MVWFFPLLAKVGRCLTVHGVGCRLPAPGQPLVTAAHVNSTQVTLAWRGAALGWNYTVEASQDGTRWETLCHLCANDHTTPFSMPLPNPVPKLLRVTAANRDGVLGNTSFPFAVPPQVARP
jgi:hypothetical protein